MSQASNSAEPSRGSPENDRPVFLSLIRELLDLESRVRWANRKNQLKCRAPALYFKDALSSRLEPLQTFEQGPSQALIEPEILVAITVAPSVTLPNRAKQGTP